MIEKKALTEDELMAGLVLVDPLLFRLFFFADELTEEPSLEQKLIVCDQSNRVMLCTGRKVIKTIHIEALILQEGITHTGAEQGGMDEGLLFTPRDTHLELILDRLWGRIGRVPFIKALIAKDKRGESPILEFYTGLRFYFKIEGSSGTDVNMVGIRATIIIGDECAFSNHVCHRSRLQTALPGCRWLYAGVPNGVRNSPFYEIDQTTVGRGWSKHKYPTYVNPIYQNIAAKEKLIDDFGGVETQGYKNNVLGEWGEEMVSSFPPGSIAVRYAAPYFIREISNVNDEDLEQVGRIVGIGSVRCDRFAVGWDYGFSPDPTEVVGAYTNGDDEWQCYFRVTMRRVPMPHQARIINYIIQHVFTGQFIGIASDYLGGVQTLQVLDPARPQLYLWSNPGGSTPNLMVTSVDVDGQQTIETANLNNKQMQTEFLKSWMINAVVGIAGRKLWLGKDAPAIDQLVGTTEHKTQFKRVAYVGPPDPDRKQSILDHIRDSLTYLCYAIDVGTTLFSEDQGDGEGSGSWIGGEELAESWQPPWGVGNDN